MQPCDLFSWMPGGGAPTLGARPFPNTGHNSAVIPLCCTTTPCDLSLAAVKIVTMAVRQSLAEVILLLAVSMSFLTSAVLGMYIVQSLSTYQPVLCHSFSEPIGLFGSKRSRSVFSFAILCMAGCLSNVTGDCPTPADKPNASHDGGNLDSFPDGHLLTYTCNPGYMKEGSGRTICNGDEWYPQEFECRR